MRVPTYDKGTKVRESDEGFTELKGFKGAGANRMVHRHYWYRNRLLQQYMHRIRYMYGVSRRMNSSQILDHVMRYRGIGQEALRNDTFRQYRTVHAHAG